MFYLLIVIGILSVCWWNLNVIFFHLQFFLLKNVLEIYLYSKKSENIDTNTVMEK